MVREIKVIKVIKETKAIGRDREIKVIKETKVIDRDKVTKVIKVIDRDKVINLLLRLHPHQRS